MTQAARLEARNLSLRVAGRPLFEGASLTVAPGELVFLTGPNGAGKTTLLDLIGGEQTPDSGIFLLDGTPLAGKPWERARRGVARLYQGIGVFGGLTVKEALNVGSLALGRGWLAPDRVEELLSAMGLKVSPARVCEDLSMGQRRLLSIARILAVSPSLMLLDEPAAGLAPEAKASLATALRTRAQEGCSIVIIEHEEAFIRQFDARCLHLRNAVICCR